MLRREIGLFKRGLLVFDIAVFATAFLATLALRSWLSTLEPSYVSWFQPLGLEPLIEPEAYHLLMVAMVPVWGMALYSMESTDFRISHSLIFWRYAETVALSIALMIAVAFLFKLQFLSRSFVVIFGVLSLSALWVSRVAIMEAVAFFRRKRVDGHRIMIVGGDERAKEVARTLHLAPPWNIKVLGFMTVEGETLAVPEDETFGDISNLANVLDSMPIDEVLFVTTTAADKALGAAVNACDERGVDIVMPLPRVLPSQSKIEISTVDGIDSPLLHFRRTPTGDFRLATKRLMDIAGATALILASGPVMLAVAIAIRLESPGPIMFRQIRSGRNGRRFTMLKFRSMVVDAEAKKAALAAQNEMSGPVFKITRDPRVTRVGAFIRKTSLDELPQFFNIFWGDMSLVGPRPPIPAEVEQYEPWQRRRLSVKPGLTGLWQVSGRNNIDFEEWMRLDLRYIDTWSLWLDFKILLRTLPAVLNKTGAS